MENFKNPKMLIVDYYDSLIRNVDIYIEELLEKYNETDLLPTILKNRNLVPCPDTYDNIDGFKDPYSSKYEYGEMVSVVNVTPEVTRTRDYLELVRAKTIEEIKKAQEENLQSYELNKELYKYDRETLTDEKIEEMRRNLFKDKFCFRMNFDDHNLLRQRTIISDFYLDEKDIDL
jgi:hypothetical protein